MAGAKVYFAHPSVIFMKSLGGCLTFLP